MRHDKRSAAWLVLNSWIAEGDTEPGASQLAIYRDGQLRDIKCEPFIRDYWFWMQGKQVAIDCGGRHFAGTQSLFDIDTLLMIDSFFQPDIPEDRRPVWSKRKQSPPLIDLQRYSRGRPWQQDGVRMLADQEGQRHSRIAGHWHLYLRAILDLACWHVPGKCDIN